MKHLFKIVLTTSAFVAIAGNASAQDTAEHTTFDVKFTFDATAPVDVTYEQILEKAKSSCKNQYPAFITGYSVNTVRRFRRKCAHMLADRAVNLIEIPSLTALHNANTGKSPARTLQTNAKPASKSFP